MWSCRNEPLRTRRPHHQHHCLGSKHGAQALVLQQLRPVWPGRSRCLALTRPFLVHAVHLGCQQGNNPAASTSAHLRQHTSYGSMTLDLTKPYSASTSGTSGGSGTPVTPATGGNLTESSRILNRSNKLIIAHMVFMILAWFILVPAAILVGRYGRTFFKVVPRASQHPDRCFPLRPHRIVLIIVEVGQANTLTAPTLRLSRHLHHHVLADGPRHCWPQDEALQRFEDCPRRRRTGYHRCRHLDSPKDSASGIGVRLDGRAGSCGFGRLARHCILGWVDSASA